jgi:hypothetical protein
MIQASDPNAQNVTHDMEAQKMVAELKRYQRKALKAVGKSVRFESDIIPVKTLKELEDGLAGCKTADEVRALFATVEALPQDTDIRALAEAINKLAEVR